MVWRNSIFFNEADEFLDEGEDDVWVGDEEVWDDDDEALISLWDRASILFSVMLERGPRRGHDLSWDCLA